GGQVHLHGPPIHEAAAVAPLQSEGAVVAGRGVAAGAGVHQDRLDARRELAQRVGVDGDRRQLIPRSRLLGGRRGRSFLGLRARVLVEVAEQALALGVIGPQFDGRLDLDEGLVGHPLQMAPARQPQPLVGVLQVGLLAQILQGLRLVPAQPADAIRRHPGEAETAADAVLIADAVDVPLEGAVVVEDEHLAAGRLVWTSVLCPGRQDRNEARQDEEKSSHGGAIYTPAIESGQCKSSETFWIPARSASEGRTETLARASGWYRVGVPYEPEARARGNRSSRLRFGLVCYPAALTLSSGPGSAPRSGCPCRRPSPSPRRESAGR